MDIGFSRHSLALANPGGVVALVAHILGFHPVDSLVVVNLDAANSNAVCAVLRTDLPSGDDGCALVTQLSALCIIVGVHEALLMVVTGNPTDPELPYRELLTTCATQFARVDIACDHWI